MIRLNQKKSVNQGLGGPLRTGKVSMEGFPLVQSRDVDGTLIKDVITSAGKFSTKGGSPFLVPHPGNCGLFSKLPKVNL